MKTFSKYLLFCIAAFALWACGNHDFDDELGNLKPGSNPASSNNGGIPTMDSRVVSYQRINSGEWGPMRIVTDIDTLKSWFPNDLNEEQNECNYFAIFNSTSSTGSGYLVLAKDMVLYHLGASIREGCAETCDIFDEAILVCDDKANTLKNNINLDGSFYAVPGWNCSTGENAPKKGFFPNHPPHSDIAFNIQYTRNRAFNGGESITTVISSKKEIEKYYGNQEIRIWDKQDDVWYQQGYNTIEKYSDDYFANNFLVIVDLWEPSGSIRHEVEMIDENGNILITRLIPGPFLTDDIGSWSIIIEINNNFKVEQFKAVFVDNHTSNITEKQRYEEEIINHDPSCKIGQRKLVTVYDLYPVENDINWDYVYSHAPGYVPGSGKQPAIQGYGDSQGNFYYNVNGIEITQKEYDAYDAEYWRKYYEERTKAERSLDIPCSINNNSIALLTDKEIKNLKEKYGYLAIEDYTYGGGKDGVDGEVH
jgi:hypothetical protein